MTRRIPPATSLKLTGLILIGSSLMSCGWEPLSPPVASLSINPPVASLTSCTDQSFQARAFDSFDTEVKANITWSVSDASKASIDQQGRLSPKESGSISVIATAQNKRIEASVTIVKDTTVVATSLIPAQTVIDTGAKTTFKVAGVNKCNQILEAVTDAYTYAANASDGTFTGAEFTAKRGGVVAVTATSATGKPASGLLTVRPAAGSSVSERQTATASPRSIKTGNAAAPTERTYFLEYVPSDFAKDVNKRHPMMIFLPGAGTPDPANSSDVLPAQLLAKNASDPSLTSMIVLTPFFPDGVTDSGTTLWTPERIQAVITAAKAQYPVDPKRIYLAGFSFGGGGVWNFLGASKQNSDQIAATVVAAGSLRFFTKEFQNDTGAFAGLPIPQSSYDFQSLGCNIEASNLPVRAVHSPKDSTVSPIISQTVIASLDCLKTPAKISPAPQFVQSELGTFAPNTEHPATSIKTWDPAFRPLGKNTYEWMLQYARP
jgi:Bacterial Ig-like domain (group 2)